MLPVANVSLCSSADFIIHVDAGRGEADASRSTCLRGIDQNFQGFHFYCFWSKRKEPVAFTFFRMQPQYGFTGTAECQHPRLILLVDGFMLGNVDGVSNIGRNLSFVDCNRFIIDNLHAGNVVWLLNQVLPPNGFCGCERQHSVIDDATIEMVDGQRAACIDSTSSFRVSRAVFGAIERGKLIRCNF